MDRPVQVPAVREQPEEGAECAPPLPLGDLLPLQLNALHELQGAEQQRRARVRPAEPRWPPLVAPLLPQRARLVELLEPPPNRVAASYVPVPLRGQQGVADPLADVHPPQRPLKDARHHVLRLRPPQGECTATDVEQEHRALRGGVPVHDTAELRLRPLFLT